MSDAIRIPLFEKSLSLDRCDIFENSEQVYPESYQRFQKSIENIFFKSELLLKCKIEFERLITIDMSEKLEITEPLNFDLNLSLIFTGAIKSGRSSLINMLLNTKIMPTDIIGSSCCVNICHPKSDAKQITVGIHDLEGWEVDRDSGLGVDDLSNKIEKLQYIFAKKSCEKNHKDSRRIHVQIPHWLLKNISIYECPAIDGMYSFDEPFDIISKMEHPMLIHVIDASNGLMEWDRTFLAKILYNRPNLPIFFVINHVDIQPDTLYRDQGPKFESVSEKFRSEFLESESDYNSTDDNTSEKYFSGGVLNENTIRKKEAYLIEKCKKQLKKLGFMLENQRTTRYAALSVKEFNKMLFERKNEREENFHWKLVDDFFVKFNEYISAWMENILVTSSLELKSRINGVVDAVRCQIVYNDEVSQDFSSDLYLQDIRKAENKIREEFSEMQNELEKQVSKSIKEQLKKYENEILQSLPDLSTGDNTQIIHIMKPKLLDSFEKILLGSEDDYNIDDEINKILENIYKHLETSFSKIYRPNKMLTFIQYIVNLFRTLKMTVMYPLILRLPEEVIQSENKWYKELLKNAARRIRGANVGHQGLVLEMINEIKVAPIIKTTKLALLNMHNQIQIFIKKYQEAYKKARNGSFQLNNVSPQVFKKLLLVDFVIKIIEKSFQNQEDKLGIDGLIKSPTFFNEFFYQEKYMVKCINVQSFTLLSDAINILCVKRICRLRPYIMIHKSTKLLDSGLCLLYYPKMNYDLLVAIKRNTMWQLNDVIGITRQLLYAVKCLLKYHQYLQIDLLPENIMLKKSKSGQHECYLYPYAPEISSISYNHRVKKKFSTELNGAIYQIGVILSLLLTNDITICDMIYDCIDEGSERISQLHEHIFERTLESLKLNTLVTLATNLLFKPEEYNNIESIIKELDGMRDV